MASKGTGADRTLRLVIKMAQFLASIYLIVAMYNIGPHWILLVASLAVPLYGMFLLFRSPERILRQHPLPYVRYKALARARSWLRVDLAICATMAVVCLAFALVLLLAYLQERSAKTFLLQAAVASLLLSLLYSLNSILSVRQLHTGQVDFIAEKQNASSSLSTTRASTQSPIGEPERMPTTNGHSSPYRAFEEGWRSNQKPISVSIQSPQSESAGQASLLEQLQTELASEHAKGRWRHIPIGLPAEEQEEGPQWTNGGQRLARQVKVEQKRTTPFGVDLGAFGSREEKWVPNEEELMKDGQQSQEAGPSTAKQFGAERSVETPDGKMLPRLAMHRDGGTKIRGDWSGMVGQQSKGQLESDQRPAALDDQRNGELRRTIERKRVRYETVASKTLVDVDRGNQTPSASTFDDGRPKGRIERRDFNVNIRPRTSPFRQSTELKLRDDRRPTVPHQVTEL